ncbi:hypothetical protein [Natronococcus occultus]|uniref:Uncharacterized protein n=1 Tax=Natronococcus occultus SP4 TaxID=694430 RepID=L0K562_9EURY|nr:hypothetical protein [Natronococcus occultus]AGB39690.1 hypothetical protein Natoc_3992 [Natronococcus occultus SP4]
MNRTLLVGVALVFATGVQLWITTLVSGYTLQVLSALATVGLAVAAVAVLARSFDGSTGRG